MKRSKRITSLAVLPVEHVIYNQWNFPTQAFYGLYYDFYYFLEKQTSTPTEPSYARYVIQK
jgi:hypothetical protein